MSQTSWTEFPSVVLMTGLEGVGIISGELNISNKNSVSSSPMELLAKQVTEIFPIPDAL